MTLSITGISDKLLHILPPAMIAVIVINIITLAVIGWAFQHNTEARNQLLQQILASCLRHAS